MLTRSKKKKRKKKTTCWSLPLHSMSQWVESLKISSTRLAILGVLTVATLFLISGTRMFVPDKTHRRLPNNPVTGNNALPSSPASLPGANQNAPAETGKARREFVGLLAGMVIGESSWLAYGQDCLWETAAGDGNLEGAFDLFVAPFLIPLFILVLGITLLYILKHCDKSNPRRPFLKVAIKMCIATGIYEAITSGAKIVFVEAGGYDNQSSLLFAQIGVLALAGIAVVVVGIMLCMRCVSAKYRDNETFSYKYIGVGLLGAIGIPACYGFIEFGITNANVPSNVDITWVTPLIVFVLGLVFCGVFYCTDGCGWKAPPVSLNAPPAAP